MRKCLLLSLGLSFCLAGVAGAQTEFPFSDDFETGEPKPNWDVDSVETTSVFGTRGDLVAVMDDVDWRGELIEPPGGNYMGRLSWASPGTGTYWRLVGEPDATNYTVEADIYVPTIDAADPPDNFLYQMIVLSDNAGGYARLHFQHNVNTEAIDAPRIRVQTAYPSLATVTADATEDLLGDDSEGWYHVRIEQDHDASTLMVYINGVDVYDGILTVTPAAFADGGKSGIGGFIFGDTGGLARSVYFDNFFAGEWTDVGDWAVYE